MDFELSVVKRLGTDIEMVSKQMAEAGFNKTGEALGGKAIYYEIAGINVTLIPTPTGGTLIFPSGPIRGKLKGDRAVRQGKARSRILKDEDDEYRDVREVSV